MLARLPYSIHHFPARLTPNTESQNHVHNIHTIPTNIYQTDLQIHLIPRIYLKQNKTTDPPMPEEKTSSTPCTIACQILSTRLEFRFRAPPSPLVHERSTYTPRNKSQWTRTTKVNRSGVGVVSSQRVVLGIESFKAATDTGFCELRLVYQDELHLYRLFQPIHTHPKLNSIVTVLGPMCPSPVLIPKHRKLCTFPTASCICPAVLTMNNK